MDKRKIQKIFLFFLSLILLLIIYFKFFYEDKAHQNNLRTNETENNTSNIIKEISFASKDKDGNEYILKAYEGEVDLSNDKVIYLKKILAKVILNNSEVIIILSDFGKYNIENYDTIFSENVIIKYLDNKITSNYMEFSVNKNLMTITKNVIYSNEDNLLKADTVELNTITKKVNIFMHDSSKKVKIINKN
tara:strand:- start:113 stop:685 length:573 start_codon:yes stop_codon:yes gene_type:complete